MSTMRIEYNTVQLDVEFTFYRGHPEIRRHGMIEEVAEPDSIELESVTTIHGDEILPMILPMKTVSIEQVILAKINQINSERE